MDQGQDQQIEPGTAVYSSWSGGKDSACALHLAIQRGAKPGLLVTMLTETGLRSRSHGLSRELLLAQADAVGVPIHFEATSWDGYEEAFVRAVGTAATNGLRTGVFGDIDIQPHREWVEGVAQEGGTQAYLPLWQSGRAELVRDVLAAGFKPMLVAVRDGKLPPDLLGEVIDDAVLTEFERHGVDLAGENGEYHTVVVDGPIFGKPLSVAPGPQGVSLRDGVWFLDLTA
ncbi:Dph6-related ATP pyrophosphatase [Flindersiella endophytica]